MALFVASVLGFIIGPGFIFVRDARMNADYFIIWLQYYPETYFPWALYGACVGALSLYLWRLMKT